METNITKNFSNNTMDKPYDLNNMINIISGKVNNVQIINGELIEELCNNLRLYCENHNNKINSWFDDNYKNDLEILNENIQKYLKKSNIFESNSFISINEN